MLKKSLLYLLLLLILHSSLFTPFSLAQGICNDLPAPAQAQCNACVGLAGGTHVWTAIGCLNAGNPTRLIGQLLGWGTIVGGGVAFLVIIFGGIQITTAAGDPKRVRAAQELITAALTGLLLIIFSIFLLNLIGFRILGLGPLGLPVPNP